MMTQNFPTDINAVALAPHVAEEVELALEEINGNHGDTVLLLACFAGIRLEAVEAEITDVDHMGITLSILLVDGSSDSLRLRFESRPDTLETFQGELFAMVHRARIAAGDSFPLTSIEREFAAAVEFSTVVTSVSRIADLTPHLRRVTFTGGFEQFSPLGCDQYLLLMVPPEGADGSMIEPGLTPQRLSEIEERTRPLSAYYTVQQWRPEAGELDVWIATGHAGGVSSWSERAEPGDHVALWGSRRSFYPPTGTSSYLLVGDESGLGAIGAILDDLPLDVSATVILEVDDSDHTLDLPGGPNVRIEWLFRGEDEPGTGGRLTDATRALDLDPHRLYAFGAAESRQISAVRRYLRRELKMSAEHVRMTGYWRRKVPG